ncbi:extracellular solute-binding protein [candidate division WWE3 bacterium]|uniref:Extracellular solute-binding protein n=1 Tax=candidate division WWE3 bacterium TaxID=2053526 RepID=A0A955LVL9_UNCKA|nr:extracellular solute-binding protein [candidate division WWE3 bacterium]
MKQAVKRIIIGLYFLTLSVVLTGCTVPLIGVEITFPEWVPFIGGESRSPVTLEYWGLWENDLVMQPFFDSYKQEREFVSVDYQVRDPRQHFETVRSRLNAGNPPDIVRVHSTWVPYLVDGLEPMPDNLLASSDYINAFYPVVSEDLIVGGRVYGVPIGIDGLALVYNEDLLEAEGITQPPQTWSELRTYAADLTKKNSRGEIFQGGAALGYTTQIDHFSDIVGLMMAQSGITFMDDEGKVNFNSFVVDGNNLASEALLFYTKFGSSEQSYNPNWNGSTEAFIEGKVAMILVPSYRLIEIFNANPSFSVKVTTAPQLGSSDSEIANWASYWVEVVPKAGQRPSESWQLLAHMMQPDNLVEFYRAASAERGFGEPYPRPDLASTLSIDQRVQPYVAQAATYTSWPFADGTHDVILNDAIIEVLARYVESVRRGGNVNDAVNGAVAEIQKIVDTVGGN